MPNILSIGTYLKYPKANPVRMFDVDYDDFFQNTIPYFEEQTGYCQKFEKGDFITGQFNMPTASLSHMIVSMLVIDKTGTTIATITPTIRPTLITATTYYDFSYSPANLTEGIYFISLTIRKINSGTPITTTEILSAISEPIHIATSWANTLLLKYSNVTNDFDIAFKNIYAQTKEFQLRVEGGWKSNGVTPLSSDEFYVNQIHQITQLSSIPYDTHKVTFGDSLGLPNWLKGKINRALSCTDFYIDGKKWTKYEGVKLEATGSENYPMRGWSIELVDDNDYSDYLAAFKSVGSGHLQVNAPPVYIGYRDSAGIINIIGNSQIRSFVAPAPSIPVGQVKIENSSGKYSVLATAGDIIDVPDSVLTEWDGTLTPFGGGDNVVSKVAPDSTAKSSGTSPAINLTGIRPGENKSIPDIHYTNFRGVMADVEAGLDIVSEIPTQNSITNTNGDVLALLDAEENFIVPNSVLTLPNGMIVNLAAGLSYTVPDVATKSMMLLFPVANDNEVEFVINADQVGDYTTGSNSNVASVIYKINSSVVSLPFSTALNDILTVTIVRTSATADSQIVLNMTQVIVSSTGVIEYFNATAGQTDFTTVAAITSNISVAVNGILQNPTTYIANVGANKVVLKTACVGGEYVEITIL